MRAAFFRTLMEAATVDPRIHLVTGDLGFGVIEPLASACPGQVINAGVAEQAMTGIAAGLALAGAKVFTYSIGNFPTLRCLEQVRNDVAYHGADVTVVAVGGGLAYGALGVSHHATEDLAIMRAIPTLTVAAPGDPLETERVTQALLASGGPAYLRLGKSGEPTVHERCPPLPPGTSVVLRDGRDCAVLVTGAMLPVAVAVAEQLSESGVAVRLVSFPWVQPIDEKEILRAARDCRMVASIEEHSVSGGLGGVVAELLAGLPGHAPLLRIGLPRQFTSIVGTQAHLREVYGLDSAAIANQIGKRLEET
ncbi:MAG: transketolase family protein [Mycobacteriales bacterium]